MSNFYRFWLFLLFFFSSIATFAQSDISLSGTVLDTNTLLPIESATVFFSNVQDSTIVEFTATDKNGFFKIPSKKYYKPVFLKVSQTGYQPFIEEHPGLLESKDFGKVYLLSNKYALDEIVIVKDVPIKVKKDTLEFNASSFKVRPDSNVETLLKELPGFEIDSQGKITVNGKEVNQVLVNGKAFFDKEGLLILKNLPAEIINKVQVSDFKTKKEELSKQESTSDFSSINITIDEKKNRGVFGKFLGGYGSDERYENSFIVNFFKDKQKIGVLASSNNINATGFSMDDVFDNMGGGRSSKRETTAPAGKGVTKSNLGGISYADQWTKKIEVVGSYDFKNTINDNKSTSKQVNFLPSSTNFSDAESTTRNESTINKANFELEYKLNPTIRLDFEPTINQSHTKSNPVSTSRAKNDKGERINESANKSNKRGGNLALGNTINFNKSFAKKSRNLSFVLNNSYNQNEADAITESKTIFFQGNRPNIDRKQNVLNKDIFSTTSADIEYTEPITDSLRVRMGVDLDWYTEETDVKTFDFNQVSQFYLDLNQLQSNYTNSNRNSIRPKAGLTYEKNKYTFNFNASSAFIDYDNFSLYRDKETELNQKYMLPYANAQIRYRISRSKYINFKYDYDNTLPTPTQLIPVDNLGNPLVTVTGNPNLNPNETHTATLNFKNYNYRKRSGYNFYLKTYIFVREIATTAVFDENGKRTTTYTNVDNTHSTSIGANWNQTIKHEAHVFRFGASLNGNYSFDKGFTNGIMFTARSARLDPTAYLSYDYGELLTIAPSYKLTYNQTNYENSAIDSNSNVVHTISLQTTSYWPKNWVFGNDLGYNYNSNISSTFNKDFYLWNTSLSYAFFDKKITAKIKIYDILNQNQSVTRNIRPTSIRDEENTVLKRYIMFSLGYKLGKFNGKSKSPKKSKNRDQNSLDID